MDELSRSRVPQPRLTAQARREWLLLLLLILVAFGLRLYNLDAFSFWTDEGLTPLRASYSLGQILSNEILIQQAISKDTHPALYYLIIHFTRLGFGETDFAYRYPSLLAGVLLVPLLYQFGRHLANRRVGLLAALLTAVNPLHVYYGNEARMYTIFALLAAAASYVLWRALTGADLRRSLLLYIPLAAAAFYTHYTAVFLIGVHALFWLWILWRAGHRRLIAAGAVLAVLIAIPVIPFTVPRLFTGAEASYYYVSPLIMLQDVVRFFSGGVTMDFGAPFVQLLLVLMLALLLVGLRAANPGLKRSFLLGYMLAAVLGLMAGSLLKPMYQGARHIMVGSPAFLLLLAIGLDALWSQAARLKQPWRPLARGAALLAAALPIFVAGLALSNLYFNPRYAKDDFRSMIAYVEQRAGEQDIVVYNNAILLPLHDHYRLRSDLAYTALPVYPYMATDEVDEQLARLAETYQRIWFVTDPPADGRDDEKRVRGWLDQRLEVVDERTFHARTTVVNTVAFSTLPTVVGDVPEAALPLDVDWDDLPALEATQLHFGQPASASTLWLDLFWDGGERPPAGASLRFSLRGPDDQEWLVDEQELARDVADWPALGLVRHSYKLSVPPGTPPATYALMVQPLDGPGRAIGEPKSLAQVALAGNTARGGGAAVRFDNGLALQRMELFDLDVRPGHTLPLALYWQATAGAAGDLAGLRYYLDVVGPDGEVLRTQNDPPGASWLESWPADTLVRELTGLYFYPETPPGRYRLRWQLRDDDQPIPGRPPWRPWSTESVLYGEVEVVPWPLETALPPAGEVDLVQADLGPAVSLHGYDLQQEDGTRRLTLYWRARAVPDQNVLVFLHVVNAGTGELVWQADRFPVDGLRPTIGWRAGEVLSDGYDISLPNDLPPGDYLLNVGMYNPDDGLRLPVSVDGERQMHDQITLTTLSLP